MNSLLGSVENVDKHLSDKSSGFLTLDHMGSPPLKNCSCFISIDIVNNTHIRSKQRTYNAPIKLTYTTYTTHIQRKHKIQTTKTCNTHATQIQNTCNTHTKQMQHINKERTTPIQHIIYNYIPIQQPYNRHLYESYFHHTIASRHLLK